MDTESVLGVRPTSGCEDKLKWCRETDHFSKSTTVRSLFQASNWCWCDKLDNQLGEAEGGEDDTSAAFLISTVLTSQDTGATQGASTALYFPDSS